MTKPKNFEEYISAFPKETKQLLRQVRSTIKKNAQKAEEVISYGMPAFKLNGMLVWFAAYTKHIGFYPGALGIAAFKKEISVYKWSKGAVQFPIDKPLPLVLITKIVKFKVKENLQKAKEKKHT
jgi:uncharacterized protein YdhG (YjbR/CyaY superfamily)